MKIVVESAISRFKKDILELGAYGNSPRLKEDDSIRNNHIVNLYEKGYINEGISVMHKAKNELIEEGYFYVKENDSSQSIFLTKKGEEAVSKL